MTMTIFNVTPDSTANGADTKPASAATGPSGEPLTTINSDGTPINPEKKEEPMVVLDGPLGRIYTQALNLAYANEDTGTMAAIIHATGKKRDDAENQRGTYVYALNMDDLDAKQLMAATDWIVSHKKVQDTEMIIALENHGNISPRADIVEQMARAHGAKVVYSRKSAMEAIDKSIRR
jgi:hypothetical protein